MKAFPPNIAFKYPWRNYQQRVLDELDTHLKDNHLHVIAPPGSGKTILGLEVALRLNKPTLIFAPSIAIRNQWVQRLCELFLQVKQIPEWVSLDIKNPKFLTVSTYQGLHAAFAGSVEETDAQEEELELGIELNLKSINAKTVLEQLEKLDYGTIIVDEAHHLKNAWWESLTKVKNHFDPTIVGLTATPPYDVSYSEWERYLELNGPVDAEISVPELVVEGDLCPHQDYLMFSKPTFIEHEKLKAHKETVKEEMRRFKKDAILTQAFIEHAIYQKPEDELDWIYTNLEKYSSLLIFLNSVDSKDAEIKPIHLNIIGDEGFSIPKITEEWMEIAVMFFLNDATFKKEKYKEHQEKILKRLKRKGLVEWNSINFGTSTKHSKLLSSSISKLKSIERITAFESQNQKENLRLVILTDFIRKEFMTSGSENNLVLNKIGVIPIFELLRRNTSFSNKIGVLTGSIVTIPNTAVTKFKELCQGRGIDRLGISDLPYDTNYCLINPTGPLRQMVVEIITELFETGHIEMLIGTKSLLGEGWDAPSINSLILASFVGSYVSSNQMRGRAIRAQKGNESKTSNIWHLVCWDPTEEQGGADLDLLKRRFKAFVGLSIDEESDTIESGLQRLEPPLSINDLDEVNEYMLNSAVERTKLRQKWEMALKSGNLLVEEVKVPFPSERSYKSLNSLYFNRTIKYTTGALLSGVGIYSGEILKIFFRNLKNMRSAEDFIIFFTTAGVLGAAMFGSLALRTFSMLLKHRDISKDLDSIGKALLMSLGEANIIQTPLDELTVKTSKDADGAVFCHMEGGTTFERSIFITSLVELIGPIGNPRYIIIRKSRSFWGLNTKQDYHSVPENLGRLKKHAKSLEHYWSYQVGPCELIFTRNLEGRKLLLRSRIHSLAAKFQDKTERINRWK